MTKREYADMWFDMKVNACANFESETKWRTLHNVVGTVAYFGTASSGALLTSGGVLQQFFGNAEVSRILTQSFLSSRVVRAAAVTFIGGVGFCTAMLKVVQFEERIASHHQAGVEYNIVARRIEHVLADERLQTDAEYDSIERLRANAERAGVFSTSQRVTTFARAIVLAKKCTTAKKPCIWLKYNPFAPLDWWHDENKKHKAALLKRMSE